MKMKVIKTIEMHGVQVLPGTEILISPDSASAFVEKYKDAVTFEGGSHAKCIVDIQPIELSSTSVDAPAKRNKKIPKL